MHILILILFSDLSLQESFIPYRNVDNNSRKTPSDTFELAKLSFFVCRRVQIDNMQGLAIVFKPTFYRFFHVLLHYNLGVKIIS